MRLLSIAVADRASKRFINFRLVGQAHNRDVLGVSSDILVYPEDRNRRYAEVAIVLLCSKCMPGVWNLKVRILLC